MSRRESDHNHEDESSRDRGEGYDTRKWDREHWERWMRTVRGNQRDPEESYGSVGGTPYQGGVFTSATYGGGAEFYSVTGMYENLLLAKHQRPQQPERVEVYQRSDERIREDICEHLSIHPLVNAGLIEVHVKDGVVILTGEVADRKTKHLAEEVVIEVEGVKQIHNRLQLRRVA